jgi:predicted nuclease of restriction endonuclease-like (RecB) superfamily
MAGFSPQNVWYMRTFYVARTGTFKNSNSLLENRPQKFSHNLRENRLDQICHNLWQKFLLEPAVGFTFVGRQFDP